MDYITSTNAIWFLEGYIYLHGHTARGGHIIWKRTRPKPVAMRFCIIFVKRKNKRTRGWRFLEESESERTIYSSM